MVFARRSARISAAAPAVNLTAVPEPATLGLLSAAMLLLLAYARKQQK